MLRGIFNLDNPVMRFLSRVADVMVLNLLFILCSIPIITIGASLSALYYCLFKIKDEEEGYLARKFFHSFKDNIRQATFMWLILLLFGLLLSLELVLYRNAEGTMGSVVRSIALVGLIFWYLITTYAFALQSRFYNTIGNTFRNAILLMFANGPRSIGIIAVAAAILVFTMIQTNALILWNLILLWILFGFSTLALINVQLLYPVIKKLMPEDAEEEATPDSAFSVNEDADLSSLGYGPKQTEEDPVPEDEAASAAAEASPDGESS